VAKYIFTTRVLPPRGGGGPGPFPATGADPLYSSKGTFSINGVTGTDTTVVWSTPVKINEGALTLGDVVDFSVLDSGFTKPQEVDFRIRTTGALEKRVALGSWTNVATWRGNGANADYEVKVSIDQGDDAPDSGAALDTWHLCSTTRTFSWVNNVELGSALATATIQWRQESTNQLLGSVLADMQAVDL